LIAALWCALAGAQTPLPPLPGPTPSAPAVAAPPPAGPGPSRSLSVEERLQRLEEQNHRLVEQNQQLAQQLRAITGAISVVPPTTDPSPPGAEPMTGAAAGGGTLMAPPAGGFTDFSAGPNVSGPRREPATSAAYGGGDLISFAPDDPKDTKGIPAAGRFGRRWSNNGLWFESPDKNFQFHIGGRTQMDATFFSAGNAVQFAPGGIGMLRDGVDARRMRIRLEGAMYENMLYCMEWDFINTSIPQQQGAANPLTSVSNTPAAGIPVPLDLWVGFRNIPYFGNIRIGNQKAPYGFERLTSSRFLNFMERSFNQDAFYSPWANGYEPGIQMFDTWGNLRGTYALGLFKTVTNGFAFDVGGGNLYTVGRLTGLLLYKDEGQELMHLGISTRLGDYDNGENRFRVRGPERSGAPTIWRLYANTPVFNGSGGNQDINLESVNVFGPWTIDAEYNFHWAQNAFLPGKPGVGTLLYSGGYVEVLRFLTGEHRTYIRESGVYDRVVPIKNAFWVRSKDGKPNEYGWGAWQVGVRYNYLNLNDKGINGGILNDITLGLNWFINPNVKFQWNYSVTDRQGPTDQSNGIIQGFGMRYAMDY
jgi:phosphate-selective porin OprO and OprP